MNKRKMALRVVERIAAHEMCRHTQEDWKTIYKFCHVALGTCKNPHKDWRKKLSKTYKSMKEANEL
jgi:hypothetical protein